MNKELSPTIQNPRWATLEVAANYISVSRKSIRRMIADGKISGFRAGDRLIRVDLNELDSLMSPIRVGVEK